MNTPLTAIELANMVTQYHLDNDLIFDWRITWTDKYLKLTTNGGISDIKVCKFTFKFHLQKSKFVGKLKITTHELNGDLNVYKSKKTHDTELQQALVRLLRSTESEQVEEIKKCIQNNPDQYAGSLKLNLFSMLS